MNIIDYIVVGSGCSGSMAAQTLVEAGVSVMMLDVGATSEPNSFSIPNKDYLSIRKTEADQFNYFIGEKGEGIGWGEVGKGAQVTPSRFHMTKYTDEFMPVESSTFSPVESLGYGGLGIGWGLQCWSYSDADLTRTGLDIQKMRSAYELVSRRIGVSATHDEAAQYTLCGLQEYQSSAKSDRNHQYIQNRYRANLASFQRKGMYLGRTPLALLTKNDHERRAYQYRDMDFYSDNDRSAWRPWITIDRLRKQPNFIYESGWFVTQFSEHNDIVSIDCINVATRKKQTFKCRNLILGSGALSTARIVLRSLGNSSTKLPMLSNPHSYIPCLQPTMLGKASESHKLGLGQLSYFIDDARTDADIAVASSYSYQSLMSFRIVSQMPLNLSDARLISQYILPAIVILIVQHPDRQAIDKKYVSLTPDQHTLTKDKLNAHYEPLDDERNLREHRERQYIAMLRNLRTYALKRVDPGHGSGIHYAGTLPFSDVPAAFTLSRSGKLHGTKHIHVADSSGFNHLPAKGLTFSLMANAHNTATEALRG